MQTNTTVTQLTLQLPQWAIDKKLELPPMMASVEERMETVLFFAGTNFRNNTGGPFAAGVFEEASGRFVSIGVNRVVPTNCSTAHAEIMALSLAQAQLKTYDLGGPGFPSHQLVVNWCPCAMCFGAILWSGIRSLVIAGAGSQLEKITGFDEGPIHPEWRQELQKRGISLQEDVLHDHAVAQFKEFAASDQLVYNARLG